MFSKKLTTLFISHGNTSLSIALFSGATNNPKSNNYVIAYSLIPDKYPFVIVLAFNF